MNKERKELEELFEAAEMAAKEKDLMQYYKKRYWKDNIRKVMDGIDYYGSKISPMDILNQAFGVRKAYAEELPSSSPTPKRVVYQDVTGFRPNEDDWYKNNPAKGNIELIRNDYPSNPLENNCRKSERFNRYVSHIKSPGVEGMGISGPETGNDQLTNTGISNALYTTLRQQEPLFGSNGYPEDVRDLTQDQIDNLYCQKFAKPLRVEAINDENLAENLFDTGVNVGVNRGVRLLQESINRATNQNVAVDGILGIETLSTINNLSAEQLRNVNNQMVEERKNFYRGLNKPQFINGWERRANRFLR